VSEDAGIEPRTVATSALAVRRSKEKGERRKGGLRREDKDIDRERKVESEERRKARR
jgi:hypothetical protein